MALPSEESTWGERLTVSPVWGFGGRMKTKSILVVDDDPYVGRLLADFVEAEGGNATTATDPRKALERVVSRSFDLVVTDFDMPVWNGADLARKVRAIDPELPVCLVTADRRKLSDTDLELFAAVLDKPFSGEDFTGMVRDTVLDRASHLPRPERFPVDWRVDYIPLSIPDLTAAQLNPRRASLRDISEHGLSFLTHEELPEHQFAAFLIYPPKASDPCLMVGEVRWTRDEEGATLSGTRSLFWGSERDKAFVLAGVA